MRKIKFKTVSGSGFKAYRRNMTFALAPSAGLHFLSGENRAEPTLESNGAGKSSVWDLFCWILKGRTLEGLRSPDLQTWGSDETIKGELAFDCDGSARSVVREANPNSLSLDGDPVGQDAIDALFGNLSLEAIGHTIIHAQGREFFFDLAPAKKMELLSETLGLERWEERSAFTAARVARIEGRIGELENQRSELEGRKRESENSLEETRRAQARWSEELTLTLGRIDSDIQHEESGLGNLERRRNEASLVNDSAGTEATSLEREIVQLEVYWGEATRQKAEKTAALRSEKTTLDEVKQTLRLIREQERCPTCSQKIDRRRLLPAAKEKVRDGEEKVFALEGEVRVLAGSEQELKEQLEEARESLRSFRQRAEDAQTTLNNVGPEVTRRQTRIRMLRQQKQEQSEAPNPYLDEVRQCRQRITKLAAEIKTLDNDIQRFITVGERTRFWIKGFKDVRLYIVKEALAQMQLLANGMLEESGLVGWELEYVSERTTKSDTLRAGIAILVKPAAANKAIRWESFSGGERQRLRLIGSRALAEVLLNNAGLQVNLEVFDEPTKGLSPRGIEDLIDMLSDQARWSRKAIWFVDHHSVPSDKFTSVVRVIRKADGSEIDGE